MLPADIALNVLMALMDAAFVGAAVAIRRRKARRAVWVLWGLGGVFAAALLDHAFYKVFPDRYFSILRYRGFAAFWHLPLVLAALAILFRKKIKIAAPLALAAAAAIAVYIDAYHVEPYRLKITHFDFTHERLRGLARPVVIAQVADIQTDVIGRHERRAVAALKALNPDLIVYCGDYGHSWTPEQYAAIARGLNGLLREADLRPPLGSFAVIGDVDDRALWHGVFEGTSVRLMSDEAARIELPGCKANLIGLDVSTSRDVHGDNLRRALAKGEDGLFDIILAHAPDFVRALEKGSEPFLALCGHTHGGQVRVPFYGPPMTLISLHRKFADYFGPFGPGTLSVCRGIGMERVDAPRLRLNCPPELRVIMLRPPA